MQATKTRFYTYKPHSKVLARESFAKRLDLDPYDPAVQALMRDCITWHKLSECACNGCTREKLSFESWQDYDRARAEQVAWIDKRQETVGKRIKKRAKALGLFCHLSHDPRGCTTKS